jgi:DNA polymerase-3 subunit delta
LIDQLLEKKNLESIIIFTLNEEKISKKLKLTHKFEKKVKMIKVEELTETQIRHFIQKKIELKDKKISEQVITFFLKKVPNNMLVINNELMKLLNLSIIEIDEKIIEANVSNYFEKDAYKLSEYFQKNQIEKFLQAFHNYLSLSSDLIPLLYLFNTNLTFIRDCLLLKANGKNIEKTAELLNAHPYRIKLALEQNNLTIKQLNDKILVLYDLNKMIIKGVTNPILNSELELIKNMTRS